MITRRPKTTIHNGEDSIMDMILVRLDEMIKREMSDCHECDHNHYIQELQELKHQITKRLISGDYFYGFEDTMLQKIILKQEEKTFQILFITKRLIF